MWENCNWRYVEPSSTHFLKTLIQAFISNLLDYCNAALRGITDTLLRKLQAVQNAAARLLTLIGVGDGGQGRQLPPLSPLKKIRENIFRAKIM